MEIVPQISSALLAQMLRLADDPFEHCGLLRGRGARVVRIEAARNVAPDPTAHFEIDPAALIAAHRATRRAHALALLGYYHTHPRGDAVPSITDARCAAPDGQIWLIASRQMVRAFRPHSLGAIHGRFDPVPIDLVVGKRPPKRVGGYGPDGAMPLEILG